MLTYTVQIEAVEKGLSEEDRENLGRYQVQVPDAWAHCPEGQVAAWLMTGLHSTIPFGDLGKIAVTVYDPTGQAIEEDEAHIDDPVMPLRFHVE